MIHKKHVLGKDDIEFDSSLHCYIMKCPVCGMFHSSSDDEDMMPQMDVCYGSPTHDDWKAYKKKKGYTNSDIAKILGFTTDSVKNQTQPNKELPKWAIAMLYESVN